MKERLQKVIARSGLTSRRKAENLIQEGRVWVNGSAVTELGTKVDSGHDVIEVDGVKLQPAEDKVYILLNKPHGYITSLNDPEGRPTVVNLLDSISERVFPVGRLDYDTEGLLVLTNDGHFAQVLQHPKHEVPRTYFVKIKGFPAKVKTDRLQKGINIGGTRTNRAKIRVAERTARNTWLEVVLREGRKRQIKEMFEAVGHSVLKIIRTEYGPLRLKNLPTGSYRFLNKKEIESVKKLEK